jgi:hypothetical protein
MTRNAKNRAPESNVERSSRPQPIIRITNRPPLPSPRPPYTSNQAKTGNGQELPEWRPKVTPGDQSRSSSQNNMLHAPQSSDNPADALLPDPVRVSILLL